MPLTAAALRRLGLPTGAVALSMLCLPVTASASELIGTGALGGATVQLTDDFELRYHTTDRRLPGFEDRRIHDYVEQVNRINGLISQRYDDGRSLTIGVQVDEVALFSNRYILDGELQRSVDLLDTSVASPFGDALVVFEKAFLRYGWRGGELGLGDNYGSFGRGIALNIKKNTDIDIDTSVRGAKILVRAGDLDFTAISGVSNRQQVSQDQPNLAIFKDVSHMVSGLRVDRYGLGPANLGLHGVVYRFGRAADADLDPTYRYAEGLDAVVSGANLELLGVGGIDWYVEGDMFGYLSPEMVALPADEPDYQAELGHAVYASASAYPGRAVVLVEAKHTQDTERINTFVSADGWEVATVPTLDYERVITEDSAAAVNSNDIYGGRIRVDYTPGDGGFIPYLAFTGLRDSDVDVLHFNRSPETIVHPIGGFQLTGGDIVSQANVGYRMDMRDDAAEGADRMVHFDGDISVPSGVGHLELLLQAKQFWWGDNGIGQEDFLEMENALVWHPTDQWALTLYQDWSNNPLVNTEGNLSEDLYGAVELAWEPNSNTSLRAFYGAYKAGIRCSGGQCRSLPGFEGARLAFNSTF